MYDNLSNYLRKRKYFCFLLISLQNPFYIYLSIIFIIPSIFYSLFAFIICLQIDQRLKQRIRNKQNVVFLLGAIVE